MNLFRSKYVLAVALVALVAGCAEFQQEIEPPQLLETTTTRSTLLSLAPPKNRVDVAIY